MTQTIQTHWPKLPHCRNPDYCKEQTDGGKCRGRYSHHHTCPWQIDKIGAGSFPHCTRHMRKASRWELRHRRQLVT